MPLHHRLWILLSQAVNSLIFGGDPDETLSCRAWREQWPKGRARIDRWLGTNHCKATYLVSKQREAARK
jgi:hypothetical protein